ncbi:TPA: hypothetical protein I9236_001817 [Citrobacter freundii]|uniref:hypothetical protein n=1 Tax=Citrobacter TaxID=544 RepID=UPI00066553FA|nr:MULTISPECIES: hypothetical protein [Citrobacter]EKU2180262.1 hypothetical protein [Citrobacter freundii]EKY0311768.1 hypothetical protein [Citrobacter freundii]EKY0667489.1 hypothetical protein [Citrobacter freundii]MBA7991175.1 hypothetical protein [Citrobacter freundii]MBJ9088755.1 hypothetical protein [Citrobacter freundii]
MGGGGSVEVKETETQKAQAEVAESMWELYQQELAPYEDVFIQDVNKMNNPLAYQKAAGDTNMSYSSQFSDARDNAANSLTSAGVNPNSGKFGTTQNSLTRQQAFQENDAINQAQSSQADQYVGGLEDALAIGSGESAQNMSALDSLSGASNKAAISDARSAETASLAQPDALSLANSGIRAGMGGVGFYHSRYS